MKANAKYTVGELVTEAGYKPDDVVGKVRVRIGGIPCNDVAKVVTIQPDTKELEVIVGEEVKTIKFDGEEKETVVSEEAHSVLEEEGRAIEAGDKHNKDNEGKEKEDESEDEDIS